MIFKEIEYPRVPRMYAEIYKILVESGRMDHEEANIHVTVAMIGDSKSTADNVHQLPLNLKRNKAL